MGDSLAPDTGSDYGSRRARARAGDSRFDDDSTGSKSTGITGSTDAEDGSGRHFSARVAGRYAVLDLLGAGGMGMVYLAYDHELGRRVAVKVLRTSRASMGARAALVREARALARLSHPNVVQVYDAGLYEGDVFVAMEYVDGDSVKEWCARDPRPPWRDILRVYIAAGQGLAGAHKKGLIHRDIKPANLLRGTDGRVRVADFGLARADIQEIDPRIEPTDRAHERRAPGDQAVLESGDQAVLESGDQAVAKLHATFDEAAEETYHSLSSFGATLTDGLQVLDPTRSGERKGTPAYMAPEQHLGGEIGPFTDQYSLCVSLYKSLYGSLPFALSERARRRKSRFFTELTSCKVRGEFAAPPESDVPGWVHRALMRGLAPEPDERYSSMTELLTALGDDPIAKRRMRRRRFGLIALVLVLAGLAAWGLLIRQVQPVESPCEGLERELSGVWDERVRVELSRTFVATGALGAEDTARRMSRIFDDYRARWLDLRRQTCESRRVGGQAAERELLGLRDLCLERRRGRLRATTELFVREADVKLVRRAVQVGHQLPLISYCRDVDALTARVRPPEDPIERERVDVFRPLVDELGVRYEAGLYQRGLVDGHKLLDRLAELQYRPLIALAQYWVGRLSDASGDYSGAETLLRQAAATAARGGDTLLTAKAWASLLFVVGYRQQRFDDAEPMMEWVESIVELADDDETRAYALSNRGAVLRHMGRNTEAIEVYRRGLAIRERVLGPGHPDVAKLLNNLAIALRRVDALAEAEAMYRQALTIKEATLGPDHPSTWLSLNNQGLVLSLLGRYEAAEANYERVLALRERELGADHPSVANTLDNYGKLLLERAEYQRAQTMLLRAATIKERAHGADNPQVATVLTTLARSYIALGDLQSAQECLERSAAILTRSHPDEHPYQAMHLAPRGELLFARGRTTDAIAAFERALAVAIESHKAYIRIDLAEALWTHGDRERALQAMTAAGRYFGAIDHHPQLAIIAEWRASHRLPAAPGTAPEAALGTATNQ